MEQEALLWKMFTELDREKAENKKLRRKIRGMQKTIDNYHEKQEKSYGQLTKSYRRYE